MSALDSLLDVLTLREHQKNQYWGKSQDLGWGSIYGGQLLGQSLRAAQQTVDVHRSVHSMQSYFLARGSSALPVLYCVTILRDGKTFSSRRVEAFQEGRLLYTCNVRFKVFEQGFAHQESIKTPPGPHGLYTEQEWARVIQEELPTTLRIAAQSDRPIEVRLGNPTHLKNPQVHEAHRYFWYRAHGTLPLDTRLHQCVWAWLSDGNLLTTSLLPHGVSWQTKGMQVESLDHVIWFHREIDMNSWCFCTMDAPIAAHARALVRGRLVQDGKMCATIMQEGLIRYRGAIG